MQLPNLSIRHRILCGCLLISVAAVAAMTLWGIGFRRVLRSRARQSCVRIATLFSGLVHDRLLDMVAETRAVADALADADGPAARYGGWASSPGSKTVLCSWAAYDAKGRRLSGWRHEEGEGYDALGIGSPQLPARELPRVAEAIAGRSSAVLVPAEDRVYALNYQMIPRRGRPPEVLQVAMEASSSIFPCPPDADGARATLRPFMATADEPSLVTVGGEPLLMVHRSVLCGGRQLGTITAAVPYGAEARYEQAAIFAIVVVAAGALVILALVSWMLTDVAMVPIERVRHFVRQIQCGGEVERMQDVPQDEAGALLQAYQQMLEQSQDWADRLMESNRAVHDLLSGAVEALVTTIEAKDVYTAGHSQRVAEMACALARELDWSHTATEELRLSALLHDIGKVGISLEIINKPGGLTPAEVEAIRQHPIIGARILSSIPSCEGIVRAVLLHHERFDGTGYPFGTTWADVPPSARLIALSDVYDALTSRRSYRPAYPGGEAIEILEQSRGTMFDPELLDVFLEMIRKGYRPSGAAGAPATDGSRHRRTPLPLPELATAAEATQ